MNDEADYETRAAIRPVKERIEDELLARPGVVAVDINEKVSGGRPTGELSIVVVVEQKRPTEDVPPDELVPAEVDGIPTDVQEGTIELQPAARLVRVEPQIDASRYDTLIGGIGMSPLRAVYYEPPDVPEPGYYISVGTLGAIVADRTSRAALGLTNFHVAAVDASWSVGDVMVQPGRVDGGGAGDRFGTLARAVLTENTDGAVIAIDPDRPWSAEILEIGAVAGQGLAAVGLAVQKRGRTTERTTGRVTSTDATVSVDYKDGLGWRTLRRQIAVVPDPPGAPRFSDSGDSGSVVLDMDHNVVGLLFAGRTDGSVTYVNPIQAVLDELDVDLLLPPPIIDLTTRVISLECGGGVIGDLNSRGACKWISTLIPCREPSNTVPCLVRSQTIPCGPTRPAPCWLPSRDLPCTRPPLCPELRDTRGCWEDFDPGRLIDDPGIRGRGTAARQYGEWLETLDASYAAGYIAALQEAARERPEQDGR